MTDFLLIHGAQHGKWCWEPLVSALGDRGHTAYALDLPGHGNDPTQRSTVTTNAYVDSVTAFIDACDPKEIVLVGHSFAGVILPEIYLRRSEVVKEIVFVAAYVLDKGEAPIDFTPAHRRPKYIEMAENSQDNTVYFDYDQARKVFFDSFSQEEARRYYEKLTPQPFGPYTEKAQASAGSLSVRKSYVLCLRDKTLPPELCKRFAEKLHGDYYEIDAGHEVMLSHPAELAETLLKLSSSRTLRNR